MNTDVPNKSTAALPKETLEKIARMLSYDVPQKQIAAVMGVSESRISQIINSEEFEDVFGEVSYEKFEEQELLNQGWDGVEMKAVDRVLQYMSADPDPDFALKAAAVANKANRRGSHRNRPIDPQQAGTRSVVFLNATYVDKLQQNFNIEKREHQDNLEHTKKNDSLNPSQLDDLLKVTQQQFDERETKTLEASIEYDMDILFNPA